MATSALPLDSPVAGTIVRTPRHSLRALAVLGAGAALSLGIVESLGMPKQDALIILALTVLATAVVTTLGLISLRALSRRSIGTQAGVVAITSLLSVTASGWAVAQAMFVNDHDFSVLLVVLAVTSVGALLSAIALGRKMDRSTERLLKALRTIDDSSPYAYHQYPGELQRLAAELKSTSDRLRDQQERNDALEQSRRRTIAWVSSDLYSAIGRVQAVGTSNAESLNEEMKNLTRVANDLLELNEYSGPTH